MQLKQRFFFPGVQCGLIWTLLQKTLLPHVSQGPGCGMHQLLFPISEALFPAVY